MPEEVYQSHEKNKDFTKESVRKVGHAHFLISPSYFILEEMIFRYSCLIYHTECSIITFLSIADWWVGMTFGLRRLIVSVRLFCRDRFPMRALKQDVVIEPWQNKHFLVLFTRYSLHLYLLERCLLKPRDCCGMWPVEPTLSQRILRDAMLSTICGGQESRSREVSVRSRMMVFLHLTTMNFCDIQSPFQHLHLLMITTTTTKRRMET